MVFSILIYYLFALVLWFMGKQEWIASSNNQQIKGKRRTKWFPYTYFLLGFFVLFSALRYRTGVDCESYVYELEHGRLYDAVRKEILYESIIYFVHLIGGNRVVFLGVLAALQIVPFYYALKTRKFLYPYVGFLLMVGPYYLNWMNGIRQCIAACFFVLASVLVVDEKKKILPALMILLAAQFHNSAYVLLVFLLLPGEKDIFRNRYVNIVILIVCAIVGQTEYAYNKINDFSYLGEGVDFYSDYLERIDEIQDREESMAFGPRRIIIFILSLELLWLAPQMKKYFKEDKFFFFSFNLFFINVVLGENLLSNVSHVFRRPFLYTLPFELISFAYLLYYLKYVYKKQDKWVLYWSSIGLACLYVVAACVSAQGVPHESTLFKFYFAH